MEGYDYRDDGAYFITICVRGKRCVFGNIDGEGWHPTQRGLIATRCWQEIPSHRPYVRLDEFVVMPNHVHGVFWIERGRATQVSPLPSSPWSGSVGAIVGAYKAAVSRTINKRRPAAGNGLWQSNYYEHIIRTDEALHQIRHYIRMNPQRWQHDAENSDGDGQDVLDVFLQQLRQSEVAEEGDTSVAPTQTP
jgi:putative transposase